MKKFSNISKQRLDTCEHDLIMITELALTLSHVDFGISQGERTIDQQQTYFNTGASRINPKRYSSPRALAKVANHITIAGDPEFSKSRAVDVFAYVPNKKHLAYDHRTLGVIAGAFFAASKILIDAGKTSHVIRWGGDWDQDTEIVHDQKLVDLPHFEIVKP
jgi:peptidoglycan L-alanyl-D-glutamate endopeptidase CwlK